MIEWCDVSHGSTEGTAYSRYRTDAVNNPTVAKIGLGYVHNLSKRTAVFATVESANVVPARARIGGTLAKLAVAGSSNESLQALLEPPGDGVARASAGAKARRPDSP